MKKKKSLAFLGVLWLLISGVSAQETEYFQALQKEIALGKELFRTGKYNAAYYQFEKVRERSDEKSEIASEAYYYMALSALRSEHVTGEKMLAGFISDYADSPYSHYARFYLGEYHFDRKRHPLALKTLGGVDREGLNESDRVKCGYMMGYSYMLTGEQDLALNEFTLIRDKKHILARPALYYWSHIQYLKARYDEALEGFRQLETDPNFSGIIPVYISHIYYKQGKYDQVVNYILPLINDVEESYKSELAKITGDSFFHLGRYSDAIQFLEYYHEQPGTKSREDQYIMGYCYYQTGAYEKSAPYLEKGSRGNDATAQNSLYHLADAYIRTGQKEKARVAFGSASEMEQDDKIREDALFNYAKLTYELSYSPFNETIKAFDKYISLYPQSERNASAYQYLSEVYMVTRNYKDAIRSIEKITPRSSAINRAYQRVTYYRGLELMSSGSYEEAADHFDKSLENRQTDAVTAGARYWRAEAHYRTGDYNSAITGYNEFLKSPGATALPEYNEAYYNLGYASFKLEDYRQAATHFNRYLSANQGRRTQKVADVYNRLGDTWFVARNYGEAVRHYQQAFSLKLYDADYALYQLAFCSGLQRDQQAKISQLSNLVSSYPQSAYLDDAIFELGRTYERENNYNEAKEEYQKIIDRFKTSTFYPKALLQLGLIHYNKSDYKNSLKYYKEVAEGFGGTPEAQAALLGIKNCYFEMNDLDAYFAYANRLGSSPNVTVSEKDSLTYLSAEKLFMAGDPGAAAALRRYLDQYPRGSFVLNANFYLAESLYSQGKYSESLNHYLHVSRQPVNLFSETALAKASELLYNAGRYKEALEYYEKLDKMAGNDWNKVKALAGMMRCQLKEGKYREAIESAALLKKAEKAGAILIREAHFVGAKSNYQLGNYDAALSGMREASTETNTEQGAEAKYLLADIYFRKQNLSSSEKEIMDFIDKGTSHQYWLAKSFILLSDIYVARKDDFQAKHTLKSLIENYPAENDGILTDARRRLSEMEAREKKEQDQSSGNPMQIKLN